MITDPNKEYVIFHDGKYGKSVYTCTIENALKCVEEAAANYGDDFETLYAAYLTRATGPTLYPANVFNYAMRELVEKQIDEGMPQMRTLFYGRIVPEGEDTRPIVTLQPEWQEEFVVWCFKNRLTPGKISPTDYASGINPVADLSFLAPVLDRFKNGIVLVDSTYLGGVEELYVLRQNKWQERARFINVMSRYISFLNTWAQGTWDILEVQKTAD